MTYSPGVLMFLSTLMLVILAGVEAARDPHQRQAGAGEGSRPSRFAGHVRDIASADTLYHELGHSHSEHIPQEEGSTRWFTRRRDILGGRPLATVEYVLEAVKRFERRHASAFGKGPERTRRRHLLASTLPLGANPNATGLQGELDIDSLYWATLKLGTPPTQTATVQIDSGSDLLWIQCHECGNYCVPTKVVPYRSSASSTATYATCSQCPTLNATLCPVGQCSIACTRSGMNAPSPSNVCQSVYGYGDNSQVLFNVQSDMITFSQLGGTTLGTPITFGCDIAETPGLITNSKVNGLAGLGRSNLSIPSQLYAAGKIKQDSFSVCLGGFEGGGALLFGNDTIPPQAMVYTPMGNGSLDTLYNATMTSVTVGNVTLNVTAAAFYNGSNDRPDAIFDTGSDLIALPSLLYNAIFAQLNKSVTLPPVSFGTILNGGLTPTPSPPPPPAPPGSTPAFADSLGPPTCYQLDSALATSRAPYDASTNFPLLSFMFPGNASLVLHPDDYVQFLILEDPLKSTRVTPAYLVYGCPFIFNTYGGYSLLGDYAMRNHYFTFDRTRQLIGFAALNCSTYQPRSNSAPIAF